MARFLYTSQLSFRFCCKLHRLRSCTTRTLPRLLRLRLTENLSALCISVIVLFAMTGGTVFAAEHHPEEFLASIQNSPEAGKKIYLHFCSSCHAVRPLIPLGAPRVGVKADWMPYTKNQTLDKMLKIVDAGLGAMPPRGGCFECSDQDLKMAIEYMLPK